MVLIIVLGVFFLTLWVFVWNPLTKIPIHQAVIEDMEPIELEKWFGEECRCIYCGETNHTWKNRDYPHAWDKNCGAVFCSKSDTYMTPWEAISGSVNIMKRN